MAFGIENKLNFQPKIENSVEDNNPVYGNVWGDVFKSSTFNQDEFSNLNRSNVPFSSDPEYFSALEETRARNQSVPSLIGKSSVQAVTGTIGMLASSVGALGHPLTMFSKDRDENILDLLGEAIIKSGQDAAPIYQTKEAQRGFSPTDATWLASGAPSVFSSIAMMLPGLGIVKGIGLVGKGLAAAENVGKIVNAVGTGLEIAGTSEFGAAMIAGTTGRHIDSYLSSAQTYQELLDNGKRLGMLDNEAKSYAEEGAQKGYQLGMLNTIYDVAELGVLLKGTKYLSRNLKNLSKQEQESLFNLNKSKNVIDETVSNTIAQTLEKPTTWKSTILDYGKVAGLEAADEMTMDVAQNEGKHYVDHKYGIDTSNSSFGERLANTLSDAKTLQDGFWGAIGGVGMMAGSTVANKFLFKSHYDNEENRITDFIQRNGELRNKIKSIQKLQRDGNNYEAEQVHQSAVNDIVSAGIKHGTIDLDINTLTNLSKLNFKELDNNQKELLINDGFDEKSPEIANDILNRVNITKDIYNNHLKKDYSIGINLKDNTFNNDVMKNYLSSVAASKDSNITSRNDVIKKAQVDHRTIEKEITKTTNGTENPTVPAYIASLADLKAADININNIKSLIENHNNLINSFKESLVNLTNRAKTESIKTGKPISVNPLEENFFNSNISGLTEANNKLTLRIKEFEKLKNTIQLEVNKHETEISNFNDNIKNVNTENYTKKPSSYSQNTIDEINKTVNDPNYTTNLGKLYVIKKQIQELQQQQIEDTNDLNEFTKNPKYREKIANSAIDEHKNQISQIRDNFKKAYDTIDKNTNDDSAIKEITEFINTAKKEPNVKDLVSKAQSDLDNIIKRKTNKEKVEQEKKQQSIKTDVKPEDSSEDIRRPTRNKEYVASEASNKLSTDLNIPFDILNNNVLVKPEHTNPSTETKSKLDAYSPVSTYIKNNISVNDYEKHIHDILSMFDKELHSTFVITKDEAKLKNNKSIFNINQTLNNLNNLKNEYLNYIQEHEQDLIKEEEKDEINPYINTDFSKLKVGGASIMRDLNKINKLIADINKSEPITTNINIDFGINN